MQKILLSMASLFAIIMGANAQNSSPYWSLAGNNNATSSSKLGTTNSNSLHFYTNNVQRMIINSTSGLVGIGTTSPTDMLHINSPSGTNPLRVQVNSSTKLLVHSGGGVSIGSNTTPPSNGLYVSGNVGIGTATPLSKLHISVNGTNGYAGLGITNTNSGGKTLTINQGTPGKLNFTEPGILDLMTMDFTTGNVGIGTTSPAYRLEIQNLSGNGLGMYVQGLTRGIFASASAGSYNGSVTGVYGEAKGTAGNHYGIYGSAYGGEFNAAGYFAGNVYADNYLSTSDRKFKTNITPLKNSLELLMNLKPSSYLFKKDDNDKNSLTQGKQIGLIADEVKEVFPELVNEAVQPAEYNKDRTQVVKPEVQYESVNYIELIPVLIASIQEQQKQIKEFKDRVDKLESALATITSKNGNSIHAITNASLEQNNPNPFNKKTIIRYSIPQGSNGQINIYDAEGKQIKSFIAHQSGQVELSANTLRAGAYTYTLTMDGQIAISKQMLIMK